jgi:hypothetical protein
MCFKFSLYRKLIDRQLKQKLELLLGNSTFAYFVQVYLFPKLTFLNTNNLEVGTKRWRELQFPYRQHRCVLTQCSSVRSKNRVLSRDISESPFKKTGLQYKRSLQTSCFPETKKVDQNYFPVGLITFGQEFFSTFQDRPESSTLKFQKRYLRHNTGDEVSRARNGISN